MSTPNDGGAASPHISGDASGIGVCQGEGGLSIRQYYKAAALQSIEAFLLPYMHAPRSAQEAAKVCGEIADAMLAEDAAFANRKEGV
jgi:hypothetical protein